jgi:hypothetical protein
MRPDHTIFGVKHVIFLTNIITLTLLSVFKCLFNVVLIIGKIEKLVSNYETRCHTKNTTYASTKTRTDPRKKNLNEKKNLESAKVAKSWQDILPLNTQQLSHS